MLEKQCKWRNPSPGRAKFTFLISWTNVPSLISYLAIRPEQVWHIVALCDVNTEDTTRDAARDTMQEWSQQFPFAVTVVVTWEEGLEAIARSFAELRAASPAERNAPPPGSSADA